MTKKKLYANLISEIQSILINEWDPAGVGNNPNLVDEYDGYIGQIIKLLSENSTPEIISDFLYHVELDSIGIEINPDERKKVAYKLSLLKT